MKSGQYGTVGFGSGFPNSGPPPRAGVLALTCPPHSRPLSEEMSLTVKRASILARKYGVIAVLTGQWRRIKHAAAGRARRCGHHGVHSHAGGAGDYTVDTILSILNRERIRTA